MGLAPSGNGENPRKLAVAKVPVPIFHSLEVENSAADENGDFEISAVGRIVQPGKYRLAVFQRDQGFTSDRLKGTFFAKRTPIEIDVPADKLVGTLDLGTIELNDHFNR